MSGLGLVPTIVRLTLLEALRRRTLWALVALTAVIVVLTALGFDLHLEHVVRSDHHASALLIANHVSPLVIQANASVSLEASHLHPFKVRELEVVGEHGVLQLDYQEQTLCFIGPDRLRLTLPVEKAEPLQREWEAFFNGYGSTGIEAMAIAEQMVEQRPAPALAA